MFAALCAQGEGKRKPACLPLSVHRERERESLHVCRSLCTGRGKEKACMFAALCAKGEGKRKPACLPLSVHVRNLEACLEISMTQTSLVTPCDQRR